MRRAGRGGVRRSACDPSDEALPRSASERKSGQRAPAIVGEAPPGERAAQERMTEERGAYLLEERWMPELKHLEETGRPENPDRRGSGVQPGAPLRTTNTQKR